MRNSLCFLRKTLSRYIDCSCFYDVAAGFFGVRPDLGWRNVLVPVQQARSVLGGVGEATRTYGAGPEKERQSAETR